MTDEERMELRSLIKKAAALVKALDDAEQNHGGLIGVNTFRYRDDLRLELSRWLQYSKAG